VAGGGYGEPVTRALPTWPVAAGSLLLGFAAAQATGVRPIGGLVLVAGLGWCVLRWRAAAIPAMTIAALVAVYLVAFVLSHVLADVLGTAGALAVVALAVGACTGLLADRRIARRAAV
jgi:hypothetical protein